MENFANRVCKPQPFHTLLLYASYNFLAANVQQPFDLLADGIECAVVLTAVHKVNFKEICPGIRQRKDNKG